MQRAEVVLLSYDPDWPPRFRAECRRLMPILGPWLAGPIEHVGSTAIPGLAAKPIIDIMAAVLGRTNRSKRQRAAVHQYNIAAARSPGRLGLFKSGDAGGNEKICCRRAAGDGRVVQDRESGQGTEIHVLGVVPLWIGEEDDGIKLPGSHHGAELLVAAPRPPL